MPKQVIDIDSNYEENLARWGSALGSPGLKRRLFDKVYSSKRSEYTAEELADALNVTPKRVTEAAASLKHSSLLETRKQAGRVVVVKVGRIHALKRKILALALNKRKRDALPTKRRTQVVVKASRPNSFGRTASLSVDDIDDFKRVRNVHRDSVPEALEPARLSEKVFKEGLREIIKERARLKDWGGEEVDLFTTNLQIQGKRYPAGFALKGPAKSGPLTPAKMGVNGDQIDRLVNAPIQVAVVQYEGDIAVSVHSLIERLCREKAMTQQKNIYFCLINLLDSYRLRMAYKKQFALAAKLVDGDKTK
jgi:DNA-binding GntR family transcriptional regulator